jgi:hypothetical protein
MDSILHEDTSHTTEGKEEEEEEEEEVCETIYLKLFILVAVGNISHIFVSGGQPSA